MEEFIKTLREAADEFERQYAIIPELVEAAKYAHEAMAALQDIDDGGLISPARHRLGRVLKRISDELGG